MDQKTILIFGVFDNIHEGHLYFIHEAKILGDRLVVVVARDEIVEKMKGKLTINNEVSRINSLLETPDVDLVLLGDAENGTYNVLKEINPDIICVGYDQNKLYEDIEKSIKRGDLKEAQLIYIKSHNPDNLHSSIINK